MKTSLYSLTSAPASRRLLIGLFGSIGFMLGVSSASAVLFQDNFGSGGSLTDPSGRATGTLANIVKYQFSGITAANEVAVTGGVLDWANAGNNGTQNWRFSPTAGDYTIAFDWAPYLGDKYQVSFTYVGGSNHPLTFGLSDDQRGGNWDATGSGGDAYDFAFRTFGTGFHTGSDAVEEQISGTGVFTTGEFEILLKFDETAGTAEAWLDGSLITTRSIDFENDGDLSGRNRYFTFGEPTNYGGLIDNFTVIPEPSMFGLVALAGLSIGFFRRRR